MGLLALPMCTHAVAEEKATEAASTAKQDDTTSEALKAIEGKWKLVTMRAAGNDAPPQVIATYKYEFKGDKLMITPDNPNSNGNFSSSWILLPSRLLLWT